jgi:uncharacterized membrane protein YphA (DoxX/SURF4 family)
MPDRRIVLSLGTRVYGAAAMAFGLIGLFWGDFASVWQPVDPDFPYRRVLAYIVAVLFLVGGVAVQGRRPAKASLPVVAFLYLPFAVKWLRRVVAYPQLIGTWLGFAEQFALVVAGIIAFVCLAPRQITWEIRTFHVCRVLFGLCAITFGLAHFLSLPETINMVPKWIPPGQKFWALATGVGHLLAGIAIVTGIQAVLAGRLLTAMILGFGAFVWVPAVVATPKAHLAWAGNAINLAVAGAAWIVADAIASRREREQTRQVTVAAPV